MEPGYEIYEYSRRGALADLREALHSGVKPDQYMAYDGSTAIVMAARCGHPKVVRELLASGANHEVRTDDGSTLLSHAVSGGSSEAVQAVLEAGVSVDEANEDGVTPLILAAHYGLPAVVELLCDAGADLACEAPGWGTALDGASGEAAASLERRGARRSDTGADQPLAVAAERFGYGCFDSGENPNARPDLAPPPARRATVGDSVRLKRPKAGILKEGDVGVVVEDDGSDCVPLKIKFDDAHDYYDYEDVVTCEPEVELPPDSDRATTEGTARYAAAKLGAGLCPSTLGSTGLSISPLGFGCHRLEQQGNQEDALRLALQTGCNFIDVAPNYTDGTAEQVVGSVLHELITAKKLRRDEVVVATKVGNVLGHQMEHASGVPQMTAINDNLCHCISPAWIEQELGRSLQRLQLSCVDCLLLHCPEYEAKADGVDMEEVYVRLGAAFRHLELEVERGRIACYGLSAAFHPLRPTDPQHLDLEAVCAQLPEGHHCRALQLPLNFAEAQAFWVGHVPRSPDGVALDRDRALEAPTLFEAARSHGLGVLVNRPLDGIYGEAHGVLRFSSLDCPARSFSELQLDNCDALEEKLTAVCGLASAPYHAGDGASGQLAAKTVKVLSSLEGVDCVLLGMRKPEYVISTVPLVIGKQRMPPDVAKTALRAVHNTVAMWFATAINEADHGTAKDWRLPVEQKHAETSIGA
mmetsp:Transcript_25161/g.72131  ORF Transcript_25161/g.72131 Transcript_25161/m.72131 type:complete len:698 (+) Transcript_25161:49-2142(+)